jgi:hypothetical protein
MRIAALRIGPGVPRHGFVGLVAATHARAGLIALTNDRLVTLVPCETGGLPNGITVDTPDGFAFERSLSVGARATVRRPAQPMRPEGIPRAHAGLGAVRSGAALSAPSYAEYDFGNSFRRGRCSDRCLFAMGRQDV